MDTIKEEFKSILEDIGCDICSKKPSKLYGVHPINPIKTLVRRCDKHSPFKKDGK